MLSFLPNLLYVTGLFSVILGSLHFFFPILFDFEHALPNAGPPLKPFRLWFIHYNTLRCDARGITWVMNHHASFGIVTTGLLDLSWTIWLRSNYGPLIAVWIALWWLMRAGSQLYLGARRGDWLILIGFAALGALHLLIAFLVWRS